MWPAPDGVEADENIDHAIAEPPECTRDEVPIGRRPFFERYIEGHSGVHVHLQQVGFSLPDGLGPPHLCATFEWPRGTFVENPELNFWSSRVRECANVFEPEQVVSQEQVAVLVDVPEFVKNRERLLGRAGAADAGRGLCPPEYLVQREEGCYP